MDTTTDTKPDAATPGAEGSFGEQPNAEQVGLLNAVMQNLQGDGKMSAPTGSDRQEEVKAETGELKAESQGTKEAQTSTPEPEKKPEPTETKPHKDTQARINELTREKKEAQEALEASESKTKDLEARIAELEQARSEKLDTPAEAPVPDTIYAFENAAQVKAKQAELEQVHDMLDIYKDSGWDGTDPQGEPVSYTPDQIKAQLRDVKAQLRQLPQVKEALATRDDTYRPQLQETHGDWWGNKQDPRTAEVQRILRTVPELRRLPNHELLLANALSFESVTAALKEATKAKQPPVANSKPTDNPPPVPTPAASTPATHRAPAQPRQVGEAELAGVRSGDQSALSSVVQSLLNGKAT